jgi:lipopolysaccharide biosynthesis protein
MSQTNIVILAASMIDIGLARRSLAIQAYVRHPASSTKRNIYYEKSLARLAMDLRSRSWLPLLNRIGETACVSLPENGRASKQKMRIGVFCHIYYAETAEPIRKLLTNIPFDFDLYLSTDEEQKRDTLDSIFRDGPAKKTTIIIVENRGRDIAPRLITFADEIKGCDLILFLHGKKSAHSLKLSGWSSYLYDALLGCPSAVRSIVNAFEHAENLGIIAPQHFFQIDKVDWGGNGKDALALLDRMIPAPFLLNDLDFPSGSMFWARPQALKPLLDLNLMISEFPLETGKIDGTLAHAIERLFFISCEIANLQWIKVVRDPSAARHCTVTSLKTRDDLNKFLSQTPRILVRR